MSSLSQPRALGTDGPVDTAGLRKARGAFFTPVELCDYLASWAIRRPTDQVLEPSCGEAAFLLSSAARLEQLDAQPSSGLLHGVELHDPSVAAARRLLADLGWPANITQGDFFAVEGRREYDAVIGNPPYIRYQDFNGAARAQSRAAALRAGVGLTALASSWAAFTVHAAEFLRPGGRLGLVLPGELLTVNYAASPPGWSGRAGSRSRQRGRACHDTCLPQGAQGAGWWSGRAAARKTRFAAASDRRLRRVPGQDRVPQTTGTDRTQPSTASSRRPAALPTASATSATSATTGSGSCSPPTAHAPTAELSLDPRSDVWGL